ncbi:MAG: hypothetical protein JKY11_07510 [Alphaproteobacteria bacterium]|nr:hypothetical protein [Alphaproteobacteria bacterium]
MAKKGYQVDLYEKRREYNRNIQWGARQSLIDVLSKIDESLAKVFLKTVATEIPRGSREVAEQSSLHKNGVYKNKERPKPKQGNPNAEELSGSEMLKRKTVCAMKAQDFEKFLNNYIVTFNTLKKALASSIKIIPEGDNGLIRIFKEKRPDLTHDKQTDTWQIAGQDPYDLIVIAEGANTDTKHKVGIKTHPASRMLNQIAGMVQRDRHGIMIKHLHTEKDNNTGEEEYLLSGLISADNKPSQSWIVGDVSKEFMHKLAREQNEREKVKLIRNEFKRVASRCMLNSEQNIEDAGFEGAVNTKDIFVLELQAHISNKAVSGKNLVLAGDAVGNGHWSVGGGMQIAAIAHSGRIDALADAIKHGDNLTEALKSYNDGVLEDTEAWLLEGIKDFYIGLPKTVVIDSYKKVLSEFKNNNSTNIPERLKEEVRSELAPDRFFQ